MKLYKIIFILIAISLLDNYLKAVFAISYFDDIANFILLVIGFLLMPVSKFKSFYNKWFTLLLLFYILLCAFFLIDSIPSFFYELYKQLTFLFFIPIVGSLKLESIKKLEQSLLKFFIYILSFNNIIILLQYTVSPNITKIFGVSSYYIDRAVSISRMSGIFENVNIYGDLSLLVYLFNEMLANNKRYKLIRIIAVISVLISTSKHAIVAFLLILLLQNYKLIYTNIVKAVYILIFFISATFFAYTFNQDAFDNKFTSYTYLFNESDNLNSINEGEIETRGENLIDGIYILKSNNFKGNGLGTWGDYSAKLNPNSDDQNEEYNHMSDSSIVHIFVEQGYIAFVYLLLLFSAYWSVHYTYKKYFLLLFFTYIIFATITMGLSSGSWPIFFSYLYSRLLFSKQAPLNL